MTSCHRSVNLLAICFLLCVLGIGLSFVQVLAVRGQDLRVTAILSLFDSSRTQLADPWPSIRVAKMLHENNHALIYNINHLAGGYVYPPVAALFYRVFINLEETQIGSILILVNRLFFLAIFFLLVSFLSSHSSVTRKEILGLAVVVLLFYPLMRTLEINQATMQVTFLFALTWIFLQSNRNIFAGIVFALALAFKPQFVLILPLILWSAPQMALLAIATGFSLFILSVGYAGLENHIFYITKMLPMLSGGYAFYPNHSANGFFNRFFLNLPLDQFMLAPKMKPVQILTLVCGIIIYSIAILLAWHQRKKEKMAVPLFGFAWLVTTLISPISWEHHYAPALFQFVWIYRQYSRTAEPPSNWFLLPLVLSFVLMASYFDIFSLQGRGERLLASYVFYGALLLTISSGLMINRYNKFV